MSMPFIFSELERYKNNDHFFFDPSNKLEEVCNAPIDKNGVFIIYKLAKGKVELVYIGSSEQESKDEKPNTVNATASNLYNYITNGNHFDGPRKITFPLVMKLKKIEAIDIYWYVTSDENHQDNPNELQANLLKQYRAFFGHLPEWNRKF